MRVPNHTPAHHWAQARLKLRVERVGGGREHVDGQVGVDEGGEVVVLLLAVAEIANALLVQQPDPLIVLPLDEHLVLDGRQLGPLGVRAQVRKDGVH